MADIPSARSKINDIEVSADAPTTEAIFNKIGANINDYLDRLINYEIFTSSGTFTVPDDQDNVYVWACGGGGGGGGKAGSGSNPSGEGGEASMFVGPKVYDVSALSSVSVTIGAGGAGGTAGVGVGVYGNDGSGGGNTAFGTLTFYGARGGLGGTPLTPGVPMQINGQHGYGAGGGAGISAAANTGAGGGGGSAGTGGNGGSGVMIIVWYGKDN